MLKREWLIALFGLMIVLSSLGGPGAADELADWVGLGLFIAVLWWLAVRLPRRVRRWRSRRSAE